MGERTDPSTLAPALNGALALLARDAVALAVAAGSLPGPNGVALADSLRGMAAADLDDAQRLAARVASLGDAPVLEPHPIDLPKTWTAGLKRLLAYGQETLSTLVEAIPADADDVEGEATEHLLEHIIARKRDGLELLERALR